MLVSCSSIEFLEKKHGSFKERLTKHLKTFIVPGHGATGLNNKGCSAQTSYITCLSCTVNECIADLPCLVLLCVCQQCDQVKGWSWTLLQGKTLFTPLTHTKKQPVFTTNLPCISRPNTATLASGGRSSLLVTWPQSVSQSQCQTQR